MPRQREALAQLTLFVLLDASPERLRLSRSDRERFVARDLGFGAERCPTVDVAVDDAQFFTAASSKILVVGTDELAVSAAPIDEFRDSKLFTVPAFRLVGIDRARRADFVSPPVRREEASARPRRSTSQPVTSEPRPGPTLRTLPDRGRFC